MADAKARISEVMRYAYEQGPQRIGHQKPCVLVSEEEWLRLTGHKPKLGPWLVNNLQGAGDIELPDRTDPPRPNPFGE